MKAILLLCSLVLLQAVVSAVEEKVYQDAFTAWTQEHKKSYSSQDFGVRYQIFKDNYDYVEKWNAEHESPKLGTNILADLTNEEYQRIYLGTRTTVNSGASETVESPSHVLANVTVDWRTKGAVTPIKNQGQCGSCWAFSAIGSTEGAHFLKSGNLVSLSEQNLMDCSKSYGNGGCNGGGMDAAFKYMVANKGIDTEASYPYLAKDESTCKYTTANIGATISSYTNVKSKDESALAAAVQKAPVSVAIDASKQSFQLYKTGIYYESTCSSTSLDHGVLAVGYGSNDGANGDYWIVKNSWGTSWGESGFIQMSRNRNNNCGIATDASYPTA